METFSVACSTEAFRVIKRKDKGSYLALMHKRRAFVFFRPYRMDIDHVCTVAGGSIFSMFCHAPYGLQCLVNASQCCWLIDDGFQIQLLF